MQQCRARWEQDNTCDDVWCDNDDDGVVLEIMEK